MKTALLISGLPRYVDEGFPSIRDALIKPNNPDIFIHTWMNPGDPIEAKIQKLYQPKMMRTEPAKIIHNTHMVLDRMMASHGRSYKRDKFVEMVYSMWYSLLQANLLKEHHRLEHNVAYDFVIRARFDITYTRDIHVEHYDGNVIHTAERPDLPLEMVDDRFAFGSNQLMNVYCGGYNLLDFIQSYRETQDGIFCGETVLYEMLKTFGIKHDKVHGLHCNHLNHR